MAEAANPATAFSTALLRRLAERGVRQIVVAPGSRSQALALAAAQLEADGLVRLHVRVDERSAGFLALGLSLESGTPVPVIVTSGTAVANLHPAMLEARHSGVALLALTADRPGELRGVGANQATEQREIFGYAAAFSIDVDAPTSATAAADAVAVADTILDRPQNEPAEHGPVHVNLAFRDPLSGPAAEQPAPPLPRSTPPDPQPYRLGDLDRTVVVAGTGAGAAAEEFARAAGLPLIAEVASGSRFGPQLVPSYREVLAHPELGGRVRQAVVFGRPNLSREVPALLARSDVEVVVVATPGAQQVDPGRKARIVPAVDASEGVGDPDWLRAWIAAGHRAQPPTEDVPYTGRPDSADPAEGPRVARSELAALRVPITRRSLVEAVWRATWPYDRLVFGASRLIREADRVVSGKRVRVLANRGLAGIDGTIATGFGIAAAAAAEPAGMPGTTRVLLGDLAFLHDVGSLLVPESELRPRIQLIVGNDRGGTIFDGLEVARTADPALHERVLYTPQRADLGAIAAAYGWEHRVVDLRGDLDRALTAPPPGLSILEVPLPR